MWGEKTHPWQTDLFTSCFPSHTLLEYEEASEVARTAYKTAVMLIVFDQMLAAGIQKHSYVNIPEFFMVFMTFVSIIDIADVINIMCMCVYSCGL